MTARTTSLVHPKYKTKYSVGNWPEYEQGLRSRGNVMIWFSQDAIAGWIPRGKRRRGGQRRYSNLAIKTALRRDEYRGISMLVDSRAGRRFLVKR